MSSYAPAKARDCNFAGLSFTYKYDNGATYRVAYLKDELTWTGIQGPDAGKTETDRYTCTEVASKVFLIRWTENSGAFVHQVVNLKDNLVFSSGIEGNQNWFMSGQVTKFTR